MQALNPISSSISHSRKLLSSSSCRALLFTNPHIRPTNHERHQTRSFVPNPFAQNQKLTAQRTLHYPSSTIYEIISDIASYSHFVPYCQKSTVTKLSSPAEDGKSYPEEATLTIGFNDNISEQFTSRVYCVPGKIVEAVSGATTTTLSDDTIAHHTSRPPADRDPSRDSAVLTYLLTRWSLRPYPYKPPPASATTPDTAHKNHEETSPLPGREKTEVNLAIEFSFANPLYAALSAAAAPKIADMMIEAFEARVRAVVEGPAYAQSTKPRFEGVLRGKS